jgi:Lrp/AsnC family transcriptional regulator for asnA, asnC and gidA
MLDDIDNGLITILGRDARMNNKEIAAKLGVSEGTIRNRVRKLTEEGVLKLSGLVDPDKDSSTQLVMLGVNLSATSELQRKAQEVSLLTGVKSVSITTGRYDLFVEVLVDVKHGLIDFLSECLSRVDGVISTESFVVMRSFNKWMQHE